MSISPEFATLFKGFITDYETNGKGVDIYLFKRVYVKTEGKDKDYSLLLKNLYYLKSLIDENDGLHDRSIIGYLSESALLLHNDNPQLTIAVSKLLNKYREITQRLCCLTDDETDIDGRLDEHPLPLLITMQSCLDDVRKTHGKEMKILKRTIHLFQEREQQLVNQVIELEARVAQLEKEQEHQLNTISQLSKVNGFFFSEFYKIRGALVIPQPVTASSSEAPKIIPIPPAQTLFSVKPTNTESNKPQKQLEPAPVVQPTPRHDPADFLKPIQASRQAMQQRSEQRRRQQQQALEPEDADTQKKSMS